MRLNIKRVLRRKSFITISSSGSNFYFCPVLPLILISLAAIWLIIEFNIRFQTDGGSANRRTIVIERFASESYIDDDRGNDPVQIMQVIRPPDWSELTSIFNVCLATQTSVDRLFTIGQVAENWRGPISLAILLHQPNELNVANQFLNYLHNCHFWFRTTVTIVLAASNELLNDLGAREEVQRSFLNFSSDRDSLDDYNCSRISNNNGNSIEEIFKHMQILYAAPSNNTSTRTTKRNDAYPQNHMRNIARNNCETDWTFMTDVDLIPKNNSASDLQEFYQSDEAKSCKKCAFVIPTFSLSGNCSRQSETKSELLDLVGRNLAEPFHFTSFKAAQEPTEYPKWSSTNLDEEPIHISHAVNYSISSHSVFHNELSFYEPFYISSNKIPEYSTQFIGYGFTRNSQTFEALVAGWTFYVLTPIFTTHCGITPANQWETFPQHPRLRQLRKNHPIYEMFMKTTWMRYRKARRIRM